MDIISNSWRAYEAFAWSMPEAIYSFFLRANFALLFPTLIAYASFLKGWRDLATLTLLIVLGVISGLSISTDGILYERLWRPWLIPILTVGLLYLPAAIAFFIQPQLGPQIRLRKRIQLAVWILFTVNALTSCSA